MSNTINSSQAQYAAIAEYLQKIQAQTNNPTTSANQQQSMATKPARLPEPSSKDMLNLIISLASLPGLGEALNTSSTDKTESKSENNPDAAKSKKSSILGSLGGSLYDWAKSKWPETTEALTKLGGYFKDYLSKGKNGLGGIADTIGSIFSKPKAVDAGVSAGFSGIEEMLGNGLFTPAAIQGAGGLTKGAAASGVAKSAASATASTASMASMASGALAGIGTMMQGGQMVGLANKIGGLTGRKVGGMGGLTAGVGAGMALTSVGIALGPVGWAGLLVGGLLGGGLLGSRLGDRDKWKTEGKRMSKLQNQGVQIPDVLLHSQKLQRGRSKEELVHPNFSADFVGMTPDGWVNNKFALSRDEKDLKPQDIWGNAAFFEKFGNDWLQKFSEDQRMAIAQLALEAGLVKEHHGTIDVNWTPEIEAAINDKILAVDLSQSAPEEPTSSEDSSANRIDTDLIDGNSDSLG